MPGIDLNSPVIYKFASFRFFDANERHVTRICEDDVLLLVFEGVLRFSEDGENFEIHPGEYHIQKSGSFQKGDTPSDSPKYLYVHFRAGWSKREPNLSRSGRFDPPALRPMMEELDQLSHGGKSLVEQTAVFLSILSALYQKKEPLTAAKRIAAYISENFAENVSLDLLCRKFHFSKSHIIGIFKKEYGQTPIEFLISQRIKRAEWLLEVTSKTAESIACECGFSDYSHFYKSFRSIHGVSPALWRKKMRIRSGS